MGIVLYTPTYHRSPGTQARIDLIRKSLEIAGYRTVLISIHESQLRKIYHYFAERLLTKEIVWDAMGELIARHICKQKPQIAILFLDVSASAVPYLKKHGIKTILSVEDLTPEYKKYSLKASEKFYRIFVKYANQANSVISSGYTLSKRLECIGLRTIPVPVGLEPHVSIEEALARPNPPTVLHAGQLNMQKQIEVMLDLAGRYKLIVHDFGILADKLSHPNIEKYREPTPEKAALYVKRAHMGLIIEYKKTYSLNRLFFHSSLLQPIIAKGQGPWTEEANLLGIKLYPLNDLDKVAENYGRYVKDYAEIQKSLAIPYVHKPLLHLL